VLRHFQNQPVTAIVGFQRVEDPAGDQRTARRRQRPMTWETLPAFPPLADAFAGADFFDAAFLAGAFLAGALAIVRVLPLSLDYQSASAPEMISISSLVICA
jgi:hypothetical protein